MNEFDEWEDEASFLRRGEEARESIGKKLLRCRRLLLAEIAECPGRRAAFEIPTELPIDWAKAARLEPQDDEPWHCGNQREPDMVVTAERGWTFGETATARTARPRPSTRSMTIARRGGLSRSTRATTLPSWGASSYPLP